MAKFKIKHVTNKYRTLTKDANGNLKVTGLISEGDTFRGSVVSVTTPASGSHPASTQTFVVSPEGVYVTDEALAQNKKQKNVWTAKRLPTKAFPVKIVDGKRVGSPLTKGYSEGDVISGTRRTFTFNTPQTPNHPAGTQTIEYISLGGDMYVASSLTEPVGAESASAEGDPASSSMPSLADIKNSIMGIVTDKTIMTGAGIGAGLGLVVAFLTGTNKIGTAIAGAGIMGWSAYRMNDEASRMSAGENHSAEGKKRIVKWNPPIEQVACYGAGYAYHPKSGKCKEGEIQG